MTFQREEMVEIGRVMRPNSSDIVVRLVKFKGIWYLDIRHWVKMPKYTGFSKGLSVPEEDIPEVMGLLAKGIERLKKK